MDLNLFNLITYPTMKSSSLLRQLMLSALLLLGVSLNAAPPDIDMDAVAINDTFFIDAQVGVALNVTVSLLTPPGNDVFWAFNTVPTGATASDDQWQVNGLTFNAPAGTPDAVGTGESGTLTGTPTGPASHTFEILIQEDGGAANAARVYVINVTQPLDIAFVLDRSGSMNWDASPGVSRWAALNQAVGDFADLYATLDRDNDRFTVTYFESDLSPASTCCNTLIPVSDLPTFEGELGVQSPGGSTGMGPGLQNGIGKLSDASRARSVLLFTDGEQNVPLPRVNLDGTTYSDGTQIVPNPGTTGSVKIFTIGLGSPSGDYLTVLQALPNANRGNNYISANGDLSTAFMDNAFINMLTQFSPQIVARQRVNPNPGGTTELLSFPLNSRVKPLVIRLATPRPIKSADWSNLRFGEVGRLRVLKNGTDVTNLGVWTYEQEGTENQALITFSFESAAGGPPPITPQGDWKVEIELPTGTAFQGLEATAIADDHLFNMTYRYHNGGESPRVEEILSPEVTLNWVDQPIDNATVEAIILKPGEDLGDLLATTDFTVDVTSGEDAGSPGAQKFDALMASNEEFQNALAANPNNLTLTHKGSGVYGVDYDGLDVAGTYQILYRVRVNHPATGRIQRIATESFYVGFGEIDLENSPTSTSTNANGQLQMTIRPRTTYGKWIGPAMSSVFTVSDPGITITDVQDQQDGTYVLTFDGDISQAVTLSVLGQEIYTGKLGNIDDDGGLIGRIQDWLEAMGLPAWLLWVLLLILLILIIIWVIRRNSSNP